MTDARDDAIRSALFRPASAVVLEATRMIERDSGETNPGGVEVTWLGRNTAVVSFHTLDEHLQRHAHTWTFEGADAAALRLAESGA